MGGPLAGFRIIELTTTVAGPTVGMILGTLIQQHLPRSATFRSCTFDKPALGSHPLNFVPDRATIGSKDAKLMMLTFMMKIITS